MIGLHWNNDAGRVFRRRIHGPRLPNRRAIVLPHRCPSDNCVSAAELAPAKSAQDSPGSAPGAQEPLACRTAGRSASGRRGTGAHSFAGRCKARSALIHSPSYAESHLYSSFGRQISAFVSGRDPNDGFDWTRSGFPSMRHRDHVLTSPYECVSFTIVTISDQCEQSAVQNRTAN